MLEECKEHCDHLIVGVQSDPSIDRAAKNRPIQDWDERIIMVKSIRWVDEIVTYETEEDLRALLIRINPDVRIVGADWYGREFTGYDLPIRVVFNSREHGYSTSSLRERVYHREVQHRGAAALNGNSTIDPHK
tara:strand:- start:1242 stop:1640 length:399 start_codon:yes stop_codon:yes gene_type:complete